MKPTGLMVLIQQLRVYCVLLFWNAQAWLREALSCTCVLLYFLSFLSDVCTDRSGSLSNLHALAFWVKRVLGWRKWFVKKKKENPKRIWQMNEGYLFFSTSSSHSRWLNCLLRLLNALTVQTLSEFYAIKCKSIYT